MNKYNINDIDHYASEMVKAVQDKSWFMEQLGASEVFDMVDIGTADASLPKHLRDKHGVSSVCYEPNKAFKSFFWNVSMNGGIKVYHDKDKFARDISSSRFDLTLLSSVLHEVFDKNDKRVISDLFNLVRIANSRFVAIRDMCYTAGNQDTPQHIMEAINKYAPKNKLSYFNAYKHTSNFKNAVEFLLKYRYDVNWEREVQENYLSVDWEKVDEIMSYLGYSMHYSRRFTPRFISNTVEQDYGIDLFDVNTHIEVIYAKSFCDGL